MLKDRLCTERAFFKAEKSQLELSRPAALYLNLELDERKVIVKPSLEEVNNAVSKVVSLILSCGGCMKRWRQVKTRDKIIQELSKDSHDAKFASNNLSRPIEQTISDNKAVLKLVVVINDMMGALSNDLSGMLQGFGQFQRLWEMVRCGSVVDVCLL